MSSFVFETRELGDRDEFDLWVLAKVKRVLERMEFSAIWEVYFFLSILMMLRF
jgi:hypothetical protein